MQMVWQHHLKNQNLVEKIQDDILINLISPIQKKKGQYWLFINPICSNPKTLIAK